MRRTVLCSLSILAVMSITAAKAEDKPQLPPGHYIYLGADANSSAPKAFTISTDGAVNWQTEPAGDTKNSDNKTELIFQGDALVSGGRPETKKQTDVSGNKARTQNLNGKPESLSSQARPTTAQAGMEHIETMDWPLIKFRPKPIPGSKDGFAQLSTTLEVRNNSLNCEGKWKLILLRSEPIHLNLELLDANGFRLKQFSVFAGSFETITGTNLVAARGQFPVSMLEYQNIRDFSITGQPGATSNGRSRSQFPPEFLRPPF